MKTAGENFRRRFSWVAATRAAMTIKGYVASLPNSYAFLITVRRFRSRTLTRVRLLGVLAFGAFRMMDAVLVAAGIGFFLVAIAYAALCERL
jgi:hypothetical protein